MGKEKSKVEEPSYQPFSLPGAQQRIMHSSGQHRKYRIFMWKPNEEPPSSGYPIIYVLDANAVFGTMVETLRMQSRRPEKTGVIPAIIVGIGYDTDSPFDQARFFDYTLSVPEIETHQQHHGKDVRGNQGGAEDFAAFIENDLKPELERKYDIDADRQTIFGHSLGGLFVLHMLFTRPSAFQTYVAGSPSIHWNEQRILAEEKQFTSQLSQKNLNVDVLLTVGEWEKNHKSRMNDNARELSERLSSLEKSGVSVRFQEFEEEGHISVLTVLINRAMRFALYPKYPN
ncbi:putative alpha/beta superfamily hydrolase [Salibacterium salarium]|uniref:alpha/beta hydrolase n=1 Tax=Salibacterium salarium TaxID=284579 RepID=UPI0027845E44|nr:alpha/beta hydrolase [Salibacterium salarium]MDQ0297936.1 putative alpha/beta superfamily hydrolase [Salibacterium salarium]